LGGVEQGRGGFTPPLNDKKIHKATWAQIFITYVIVTDNTIKTHLLKKQVAIGYTRESRYRDQKHVPIPILRVFFFFLFFSESQFCVCFVLLSALFNQKMPFFFLGGGE
jgi:hypothetical protein